MKARFVLGLAIALLSIGAAFGDEAASFKKYMQGQMDVYMAAFKKKDAKAVEACLRRVMDKSFVETGLGGRKMTLEQIVAETRTQMTMFKTIKSMKMTLDRVSIKGDTCTANESFVGEFVIPNPQSKTKESVLRIESKSIGGYKKFGGVWKGINSKSLSQTMLLDGRPVPQQRGK